MSTSPLRSTRVDLLRGASILAVLTLHFSLSYNLADSLLARVVPGSWVRAAVINGNYGVTVFFVISGFLITSNNLRRYGSLGNVDLRQFYAFRFARIIPPLLLALAVIVPLGLFGIPSFSNAQEGQPLPDSFFWIATLSVLTFWHNVLMQSEGWFNYCLNIYWSLSIEEVFYLTFPLACVIFKRKTLIVGLCAVFILLGPLYRSAHTDDELFYECGYLACFDAIAFGCLTALGYRRWQTDLKLGKGCRLVAAGALAITYLLGIDGHEVLGFSSIAFCAAILLSNAFEEPPEPSRSVPARVLGWLGRHSYELYLFHIIVLAGMRIVVPPRTMPYALKIPYLMMFLALSALLAGGVARWVAEPLNQLVRSFSPAKKARPPYRENDVGERQREQDP